MKLTVIRVDGLVQKDNVGYGDLNLSFVPENVHALQWNETKGWVEFVEDENFNKPQNEMIEALPQWALDAVAVLDAATAARIAKKATQVQPISQGAQDL